MVIIQKKGNPLCANIKTQNDKMPEKTKPPTNAPKPKKLLVRLGVILYIRTSGGLLVQVLEYHWCGIGRAGRDHRAIRLREARDS
jgi:hypothetical protein